MVVSRDRTNELSRYYQQERDRQGKNQVVALPVKQASAFHQETQEITKDLLGTTEMLENLSSLTRKSNAFEDYSSQVNELTMIVKQRMSDLHERIQRLATIKPASASFLGNGQADEHSSTVIKSLTFRLSNTTKAFQDLLTQRSKSMKQVSDRRSKFTHSSNQEFTSSVFRNAQMEEEAEQFMPLRQIQQTSDSSLQYYQQRQEGVKMLEETIGQLGTLFKDFSRIVAEQEEMFRRIDTDTEEAVHNMQMGQDFLLKHLKNISNNRSLILKIFGILFVFVIVFGLFVVR